MPSGKKVIMVNGESSKWYEQAIFIVKDENQNIVPEANYLVSEAEKIINNYFQETKKSKKNERGSREALSLNIILNICITICSVFLIACIFVILH